MPEEINPKFFRFFMRVLVSRKMNSHLSPTTTGLKNFEPYHEVLIFSPRSEEREKEQIKTVQPAEQTVGMPKLPEGGEERNIKL